MEFPSYKFRRAQLLESKEITVAHAKSKLEGFIAAHKSRYAEITTCTQVLRAIESDCWMNVPGNMKGKIIENDCWTNVPGNMKADDYNQKPGGEHKVFDEALVALQVSIAPNQLGDLKTSIHNLLLTLVNKYWQCTDSFVLCFYDVRHRTQTGVVHTVLPFVHSRVEFRVVTFNPSKTGMWIPGKLVATTADFIRLNTLGNISVKVDKAVLEKHNLRFDKYREMWMEKDYWPQDGEEVGNAGWGSSWNNSTQEESSSSSNANSTDANNSSSNTSASTTPSSSSTSPTPRGDALRVLRNNESIVLFKIDKKMDASHVREQLFASKLCVLDVPPQAKGDPTLLDENDEEVLYPCGRLKKFVEDKESRTLAKEIAKRPARKEDAKEGNAKKEKKEGNKKENAAKTEGDKKETTLQKESVTKETTIKKEVKADTTKTGKSGTSAASVTPAPTEKTTDAVKAEKTEKKKKKKSKDGQADAKDAKDASKKGEKEGEKEGNKEGEKDGDKEEKKKKKKRKGEEVEGLLNTGDEPPKKKKKKSKE